MEEIVMASERLHEEIDRLRTVRDELRVQANLGAKEVRDRFEETEKRWGELEVHLKGISHESREAMRDIGEAGRELLHEIRHAYERIRAQV